MTLYEATQINARQKLPEITMENSLN